MQDDVIIMAITINGKRRAELEVALDTPKEVIIDKAKVLVAKWLVDKKILKEIVVPNKLVNLVVV